TRSQLSIRGVMADDVWIKNPDLVKDEFVQHFSSRFGKPTDIRASIDMNFPKVLSSVQKEEMECNVSKEELKRAVWDYGMDKSPGCNSSFIALIPKTPGANMVKDFRPISLIRSMYKIIAKILTNRLVGVIGDIVNEVQSAFIADRQILDGPWDFLDEVLQKFGFGNKWRMWIQSSLRSSRGSILVNGSPTEEFQFYKGINLSPSVNLSHMFYADDAVFIGHWNDSNINTHVNVLECFYRASGLRINMCKSKIIGFHVEGKSCEGYTWRRLEGGSEYFVLILSCWLNIMKEVSVLQAKGVNVMKYVRLKLGGAEQAQLDILSDMVREVGLVHMSDRYTWSLEGSGDFSVAFIRKVIDDKFLPNVSSKTRWVKYVPIKNIIMDQSAGLRMFGSDTIKLDIMDRMNFTRWKEKMKFLLTAFKVYYILEEPPVRVMTEEEQRKREQDETLCIGYILSTLTDRLKKLMHTLEDFTLDQIQKHLRIEEETHIREKNLNGASSSKVNYVDSRKNNKGNNKKRKGTWNSSKENKKYKKPSSEVVCYKCGEKGHIKRYCKNPKKKNQNLNKKDESANDWWYDSGATTHVCNKRDLFKTYKETEDVH
nr:RNA-directed DNA polymerase, eukaryota [Tanacetum cinerariifolium]